MKAGLTGISSFKCGISGGTINTSSGFGETISSGYDAVIENCKFATRTAWSSAKPSGIYSPY